MNTEFKPGQLVLVRDYDCENWSINMFSHVNEDQYVCLNNSYWNQCISFEENKHLVGTKNNPELESWIAKKGEYYYYLNSVLDIIRNVQNDSISDYKRHKQYNYFKTKKEAEDFRQRLLLILAQQ